MPWTKWLSSNQCFEILLKCAKRLLKDHEKLIRDVLELGASGKSKDDKRLPDEYDVAHDLWIFLAKEAPTAQLQHLLVIENFLALRNLIIFSYVMHLRDIRRRKKGPESYRSYKTKAIYHYYRNACDTFSNTASSNFQYQGKHPLAGACFAFSGQDLLVAPLATLCSNHYVTWLYPLKYLAPDVIFEATTILDTAQFFWKQSLEPQFLGGPFLLPVWELASYVFSHVQVEWEPENVRVDEDDEPVLQDPGAPALQHESLLKRELERCALRAAASWQPEVRKAFFLKFNKDLTLQELRTEGITSPQYRVDMAVEALKAAWTECIDWKDNEDLDEETLALALFFCNCLVAVTRMLNEIEERAVGVARSWDPDVAKVYYQAFYQESSETLQAEGMQQAGPRLDQAVNQIRNFWTLWYGECSEEAMADAGNELLFKFFCDRLAEFCKPLC
jgi:hypothetical protein